MRTKKLLSIILTICVVNLSFISLLPVSAQTTGSAYNQVIQMAKTKSKINIKKLVIKKRLVIKNKKDFLKFMTTPKYWENDYKIKLKNNIDMQGEMCNSIETFNGQFDGCGHTIENISFKCFIINNHGKISNIKFKDDKLVDGSECGFVANNEIDGVIDSCSIDNVNSEDSNIKAGFVCINKGLVKNSETATVVKNQNDNVGGFVSENYGTIEKCVAKGNVNGSDSCVGGFVAVNNGTITNCNAEGNVNLTTNFCSIGGFVGNNNGTITDCTVAGNVNGRMTTGGFVGYNSGILTNCHAKVNVSGLDKGFGVGIFMGSSKWVGYVGHTKWEGITNCTGTGILTETLDGESRQQNINV